MSNACGGTHEEFTELNNVINKVVEDKGNVYIRTAGSNGMDAAYIPQKPQDVATKKYLEEYVNVLISEGSTIHRGTTPMPFYIGKHPSTGVDVYLDKPLLEVVQEWKEGDYYLSMDGLNLFRYERVCLGNAKGLIPAIKMLENSEQPWGMLYPEIGYEWGYFAEIEYVQNTVHPYNDQYFPWADIDWGYYEMYPEEYNKDFGLFDNFLMNQYRKETAKIKETGYLQTCLRATMQHKIIHLNAKNLAEIIPFHEYSRCTWVPVQNNSIYNHIAEFRQQLHDMSIDLQHLRRGAKFPSESPKLLVLNSQNVSLTDSSELNIFIESGVIYITPRVLVPNKIYNLSFPNIGVTNPTWRGGAFGLTLSYINDIPDKAYLSAVAQHLKRFANFDDAGNCVYYYLDYNEVDVLSDTLDDRRYLHREFFNISLYSTQSVKLKDENGNDLLDEYGDEVRVDAYPERRMPLPLQFCKNMNGLTQGEAIEYTFKFTHGRKLIS